MQTAIKLLSFYMIGLQLVGSPFNLFTAIVREVYKYILYIVKRKKNHN